MLKLVREHPRLLLFGVLTAFFSGPGQTFLVSLFIPSIRDAFGMTQAGIAGFYSTVTLVSALILPFSGRILDRSNLTLFSLVSGFLLFVGCFILSSTQNLILLFLGFLLIRNLGQGTMVMISSTTMARLFGSVRGKALGISNLGYPLSEAIFPSIVTLWIAHYGWRSGWMFLGILTLILFVPLCIFLLWGHDYEDLKEKLAVGATRRVALTDEENQRHWSVKEMLKDKTFYLLIFPMMIPPTFFTGLFFHQIFLMEWKGWGAEAIAIGFVAFGVFRALVSFLVGPMIDRFTAKKLFSINLIPFLVGLLFFILGNGSHNILFYLGFSGMSMGLGMTMSGALYAELYGTKKLGSIKGLISFLVVLSTAVSPVLMGWIFDQGIDPSHVLWGMFLLTMIGTGFAVKVSSQ